MGFIWTPVFSIGTRDLPAHLGGVASGVINTIQELGGVLASAVLGAFLQTRLAMALRDQAVAASGQLPDQYRSAFVSGFSNAAHTGFRGRRGTVRREPAAAPAGPGDSALRLHSRVRRRDAPNPGSTHRDSLAAAVASLFVRAHGVAATATVREEQSAVA